jgi:hypothetical protein
MEYEEAIRRIENWAYWSRIGNARLGYPPVVSFARLYNPSKEDRDEDYVPEQPRATVNDNEAAQTERCIINLSDESKIVIAARYLSTGYLKDNYKYLRMTHDDYLLAVDKAIREFCDIFLDMNKNFL